MMPAGLVGLGVFLAAAQVPSVPVENQLWLGVFKPLPGARFLCDQSVLGFAGGDLVSIHSWLFGSTLGPRAAAQFYSKAHKRPLPEGSQSITIRANEGKSVLSVQPVSEPFPHCGVEPSKGDRTIVVLSHMADLGAAEQDNEEDEALTERLR